MPKQRRKTIRVTATDIRKGEQGMPSFCPIARAMQRCLCNPVVEITGTCWKVGDKSYCFPKHVAERIWRYDLKGKMTPFEFTVEVPDAKAA